jgi:hypothetical protein
VHIAGESQKAPHSASLVVMVKVETLGAGFVGLAADSAFAVLQAQQALELAHWQPVSFFAVGVRHASRPSPASLEPPQTVSLGPHWLLTQPPKNVNNRDCQPELLHVPPPSGTSESVRTGQFYSFGLSVSSIFCKHQGRKDASAL